MCKECENLRWEIAATRMFSPELTDPSSIVLNKADLKTLDERLRRAIAERHPADK